MADINIQRKKSSPSPWLLVLVVLLVLGLLAYFFLREPTAAPEPLPAGAVGTSAAAPGAVADSPQTAQPTPPPADGGAAVADMATDDAPVSPEELAAYAKSESNEPDYGRRGMRMLSATLVDLADRDDLRDATVQERRNDLTSATSRLNEENASLRPGLVAATSLMQAMQQKSYPELEKPVGELAEQAQQLSGRSTAADQEQLHKFFAQAAEVIRTLSQPAEK
ncbi:hypothetical protein [Hymenobacter jejuensis]|uniref:Uncharacterized protein n=1 Tax=Hymenobacter jejuensis TaxID=2502781 RepID=A0A5B8A0R3_9BACT|nr:hypothetical protein [Hymenobacter jejuensis]QDA59722.1 hypothetical protein FHG12_06200 [Hymenobacter jejuensis]